MPFDDRDFPDLPRGERAISPHSRRLVAIWLYTMAGMILVMIALGGVTRLTGSGLSIMEWAPIMGAIPPLSEAEWRRLYALYQQIPQYSLVNDGFGLTGFKQIFWLEWTHRLWGRLIGAAFLVPLLWFAASGRLERRFTGRLVILFLLGGLQGSVGWFMVASGFFPDATAVAPARLVVHLGLALLLYAAVLWSALSLLPLGPRLPDAGRTWKVLTWLALGLVALTIVAGGFVSGLHAGLTYNTFPLMDGRLVPNGYADLQPFAFNWIANIPAAQFDHRLLASLTLLAASGLAVASWPYRPRLGWRAGLVLGTTIAQYALGVTTLLLVVPVGLALLHQICATILLTAVLLVAHAVRPVRGYVASSPLRSGRHRTGDGLRAGRGIAGGGGASVGVGSEGIGRTGMGPAGVGPKGIRSGERGAGSGLGANGAEAKDLSGSGSSKPWNSRWWNSAWWKSPWWDGLWWKSRWWNIGSRNGGPGSGRSGADRIANGRRGTDQPGHGQTGAGTPLYGSRISTAAHRPAPEDPKP